MAPDIVWDSTFGQIANALSRGRLFPYADQRDGYAVPARYLPPSKLDTPVDTPVTVSRAATLVEPSQFSSFSRPPPFSAEIVEFGIDDLNRPPSTLAGTIPSPPPRDEATLCGVEGTCKELKNIDTVDLEKQQAEALANLPPAHPYLVSWDGDDDPDNPKNWSMRKKIFVSSLLSSLTFAIYLGSAIYTSSIPGLKEQFDVGGVTAATGISLFVVGYGVGPMLLAPIQELPSLGRNPVYIWGLFLFVILELPAIFAPNMATVLAMRFFSGFVGSPALATGGATLGDMWEDKYMAVAIGAWSMGAIAGPVSGPTLSGFATMNLNWTWSFIELTIIGVLVFLVLFFLFPETNGETVLVKRAQRLRRLTGNNKLRAPAELEGGLTVTNLLMDNLTRTAQLSIEPLILVPSLYIALVYSVLYSLLEAFPIVFEGIYHFNLGVSTLPYLSFLVTASIGFVIYCMYHLHYLNPRKEKNPHGPELYLELGLIASAVIPISLLLFGWTSRAEIHWMAPVVFISIYLPVLFYSFQSILTFISMSYPKDAAAALAANDLIRSCIAGVFPLFASKMYTVLGVGGASSLLAGASVLLSVFLFLIKRNGPKLRARSPFAKQ
ncbi:hypothetical protein JCM8547_007860 [Rhodosporidiobolus lusitaniae]